MNTYVVEETHKPDCDVVVLGLVRAQRLARLQRRGSSCTCGAWPEPHVIVSSPTQASFRCPTHGTWSIDRPFDPDLVDMPCPDCGGASPLVSFQTGYSDGFVEIRKANG